MGCAVRPLPSSGSSSSSSSGLKEGVGHAYRLLHWQHADVLVYFSHERVTMPPVAWVEAAHRAGVRVLGTLITEWAPGTRANDSLCSEDPACRRLAALQLARLAAYYGFDGWLVNVEAHLTGGAAAAAHLESFVRTLPCVWPHPAASRPLCRPFPLPAQVAELTASVHALVPGPGRGLVLWYDSVRRSDGAVAWQSELTDENEPFLRACDGIFLDYHWDEGRLGRTAARAAQQQQQQQQQQDDGDDGAPPAAPTRLWDRSRDVFVGVDVWGRGCPGGGGWATRVAVDLVRAASAASAAPATDSSGPDATALRSDQAAVAAGPSSSSSSSLSVALFGPAWAYESRGGAEDPAAAVAAEARLWSGAGDVEFRPPPLLLHWEVRGDDAQCWSERSLLDGEGSNPTGASVAAVTSHRWSEAACTLWFAASDAVPPLAEPGEKEGGRAQAPLSAPSTVTVSEWYRGTPPNTADLYRLRACLVDRAGAPLLAPLLAPHLATVAKTLATRKSSTGGEPDSALSSSDCCWLDSGILTCAAAWQLCSLRFGRVPPAAAGVRVTHSGRDAETWAGHFGAQMAGLRLEFPRPPADALAAAVGAGLGQQGLGLPVDKWAAAAEEEELAEGGESGGLETCDGGGGDDNTRALRVAAPARWLSFARACGVRPWCASLPARTTFCDGVGAAGLFQRGAIVRHGPWVDIGRQDALPHFDAHLAGMGLEPTARPPGGRRSGRSLAEASLAALAAHLRGYTAAAVLPTAVHWALGPPPSLSVTHTGPVWEGGSSVELSWSPGAAAAAPPARLPPLLPVASLRGARVADADYATAAATTLACRILHVFATDVAWPAPAAASGSAASPSAHFLELRMVLHTPVPAEAPVPLLLLQVVPLLLLEEDDESEEPGAATIGHRGAPRASVLAPLTCSDDATPAHIAVASDESWREVIYTFSVCHSSKTKVVVKEVLLAVIGQPRPYSPAQETGGGHASEIRRHGASTTDRDIRDAAAGGDSLSKHLLERNVESLFYAIRIGCIELRWSDLESTPGPILL